VTGDRLDSHSSVSGGGIGFSHLPPPPPPLFLLYHYKHLLFSCGLTFKQPGWYLNFSAWFMQNVLFEQKKIHL
jgi:hypothetical protein